MLPSIRCHVRRFTRLIDLRFLNDDDEGYCYRDRSLGGEIGQRLLIWALERLLAPQQHLSFLECLITATSNLLVGPPFKMVKFLKLQFESPFYLNPDSHLYGPEMWSFFQEMPQIRLENTKDTLTTMNLTSSFRWGWCPPCPALYQIHFPSLVSLTLGNHTFSDLEQVSWVVSHSKLQFLRLIDSHIVAFAENDYFLLSKGKFIWPHEVSDDTGSGPRSFRLRWRDVFQKWKLSLKSLRQLRLEQHRSSRCICRLYGP